MTILVQAVLNVALDFASLTMVHGDLVFANKKNNSRIKRIIYFISLYSNLAVSL
jgi:hypothetical protein